MEATNPSTQWLDQWLSMQQDTIEMFSNAWQPKSGATTPPQDNAFTQFTQDCFNAMQEFWQSAPTQAAPGNDAQALWHKVQAQNQAFMQMAGLFQQMFMKQSEMGNNPEQWQQSLGAEFDKLQKQFSEQQVQNLKPLSDIAKSWTSFWTQLSGIVAPMYIDTVQTLQDIDQTHLVDQLFPGLGYTREKQEKIKKGIKLWSEYQQAYTDYQNAMAKIALEALDSFREKLFEYGQSPEKIDSLRKLYGLWVDCYEAAFASFSMTDECARLYGSLVNSGMAFRRHHQEMTDELLRSMNLPTRESLETLTRRQQELRREINTARHQSDRIDELEAQLATLQEQVAKMGTASKSRTKAKASAKRSTKSDSETKS